MQKLLTPVRSIIESQLKQLNPLHLSVVNESARHKRGTESHFKITIVSDSFQDKSTLERQRLVHRLLFDAWSQGLHSLSITAKTASEWDSSEYVNPTPPCQGNRE